MSPNLRTYYCGTNNFQGCLSASDLISRYLKSFTDACRASFKLLVLSKDQSPKTFNELSHGTKDIRKSSHFKRLEPGNVWHFCLKKWLKQVIIDHFIFWLVDRLVVSASQWKNWHKHFKFLNFLLCNILIVLEHSWIKKLRQKWLNSNLC